MSNTANTTLSQVQQVLHQGAGANGITGRISYDQAMAIRQINNQQMPFNENDPAQMRLLDEVLDTLNYKNGQAQKVDGQISEFMHPNAKKAQKIIDDEREAIRKLNNSAVMPTEGAKGEVEAPVGLINLFEKYG